MVSQGCAKLRQNRFHDSQSQKEKKEADQTTYDRQVLSANTLAKLKVET
jgi:hypothetical protein